MAHQISFSVNTGAIFDPRRNPSTASLFNLTMPLCQLREVRCWFHPAGGDRGIADVPILTAGQLSKSTSGKRRTDSLRLSPQAQRNGRTL